MARPKAKMPAYRYHISGQAIVTIDGKDFYLGPHETAISLARYAALIQLYQANNLRLPDDFEIGQINPSGFTDPLDAEPTDQFRQPVKVRDVTAAYRREINTKYSRSDQEIHRHSQICSELELRFGDVLATNFGPVKLREYRQQLVDSGKSRKYINRLIRIVVAMFTHAVSEELIDVNVAQRLKSLPTLRQGQTTAPETKRRQAADIDHVRQTAVHLSPVVKAMLQVQLGTGMRPKELCNIRPCDIDQSGHEWIYQPEIHKTSHHGIKRVIPIVGEAREALELFINRPAESYCFSPAEAMHWLREQRRAARKTPDNQGNRPGTNRKAEPKKSPGEKYESASYRRAIQYAAKHAGVPKWTPYQIRHLTACEVRDAIGIEAVSALLGHTTTQMSEHYAKLSKRAAIQAAGVSPRLSLDQPVRVPASGPTDPK